LFRFGAVDRRSRRSSENWPKLGVLGPQILMGDGPQISDQLYKITPISDLLSYKGSLLVEPSRRSFGEKKERNFCCKTEYLRPLLRVGGSIIRQLLNLQPDQKSTCHKVTHKYHPHGMSINAGNHPVEIWPMQYGRSHQYGISERCCVGEDVAGRLRISRCGLSRVDWSEKPTSSWANAVEVDVFSTCHSSEHQYITALSLHCFTLSTM